MKALVLGATGVMGRRVSAELARSTEIERLTLSARAGAGAERLTAMLGGGDGKITPLTLDVSNQEDLVGAMRDVDVVVGCAGPFYSTEIDCVRAAIDAGTHYISLCDDQEPAETVMAMDGAAKDAGVTIISGCGLSPGITNLLVALGAEDFDEIDEIELSLAASSADHSGPATALHFLATISREATLVSDHAVDHVPAASAPKLVYFPEPVGWVETFRCGHPEIVTLAAARKDVRALRYRMGLTERAAMDVMRASIAAGLLKTERRRQRWLQMSDPLRPILEAMPPRGAPWTGVRVDVRGARDGRSTTISLGATDRLTNLGTIPIAHGALEIAKGGGRGVRTPDQVFEPRKFLRGLVARGLRIARLEPQHV